MAGNYIIKVIILMSCTLVLSTTMIAAQEFSSQKMSGKQKNYRFAQIGHKSGGIISINELLSADELRLVPPLDTLFQITTFTLTRTREGATPVEAKSESGGKLSNAMKDIVKHSLTGDIIYFEYINCKGHDGSTRKLGSISFVIE